MENSRDYYDILGVSRFASAEEIKSAHRKLVMKYHPDKGGDPAKFQEVQKAYETLSDDRAKSRYDYPGFSTDFLFPRDVVTRGENLEVPLIVNIFDLMDDSKHSVSYKRKCTCNECSGTGLKSGKAKKTCFLCNGSGQERITTERFGMNVVQIRTCTRCDGIGGIVSADDKCNGCDGSGMKEKDHTINITVPRGMHSDKALLFREDGHVGKYNGPRGNLGVRIRVSTPPGIRRMSKQQDIACFVNVPYWRMVFGGEVSFAVNGKQYNINLPQKCQPPFEFCVTGAGLPILGRQGYGDLRFVINVSVDEIDKEREAIIDTLRNMDEKKT